MRPRSFFDFIATRAPGVTGAVFCVAFALGASSCKKESSTPEWDSPGGSSPAVSESSEPKEAAAKAEVPVKTPAVEATAPSGDGLRFVAYNVENWLTMDRYVDRKPLKNSTKPESEKSGVVKILVDHAPDVIGICEIGDAADLGEIQGLLKDAGLDLPHLHFTGGSDPVRHLGILSRFPITSTAKPAESDFQIQGQQYSINRGILDATIEARGKSYRFLGVHLKSKREVDYVDQEEMRIHEARLLRRHVDAIEKENPDARLVVYGDFNDTRPSKAFKAVTGSYNSPGYLTAIPFRDSRGDAWTHHWSYHDIYSRIDFVAVSKALKPEVDFKNSFIIDDEGWDKSSDHRAVLAIFN